MTVRLFVDAPLAEGASLGLPAAAARHVQVLRLQPGDTLTLFDGGGGEWTATVARMGRSEVDVVIGAFADVHRELVWPVTLAVGMPANERMDALVEKACELGMAALQPLVCERSVLRLSGDRALRRQAHWQAIAVAATEQCGRTRVPVIAPVRSFAEWLPTADATALRVVLSPQATIGLTMRVPGAALVALSGPEGGLSQAEESLARRAGFVPVSLGPRVLRADTAPLALLAQVALLAS